MLDQIKAAYERISGKFPPEWEVEIRLESTVGRRKKIAHDRRGTIRAGEGVQPVSDWEFEIHVQDTSPRGAGYAEYSLSSLDEIDDAAERLIAEIRSDYALENKAAPLPVCR